MFSTQSIASARLRNIPRFGQPGLPAMKPRKRLLSAPLWSLRKMIHSTSLRATGSEMVAATSVALLAPPWRSVSMALLTSAVSGADVCGGGPCASGICGTTDFSGAALSLDLPATFFPAALAAFPEALAVVCAPLAPRAAAGSAARVIASALAQASAATSADRYRVFKFACPQIPGESLRPNCNSSTRPLEFTNFNAAIFGRKNVAIVADVRRMNASKSVGHRPDERRELRGAHGGLALTSRERTGSSVGPGPHQSDRGAGEETRTAPRSIRATRHSVPLPVCILPVWRDVARRLGFQLRLSRTAGEVLSPSTKQALQRRLTFPQTTPRNWPALRHRCNTRTFRSAG